MRESSLRPVFARAFIQRRPEHSGDWTADRGDPPWDTRIQDPAAGKEHYSRAHIGHTDIEHEKTYSTQKANLTHVCRGEDTSLKTAHRSIATAMLLASCALPTFAQVEGEHISVSSAHPIAAIQD